jgi:hypothetical protein
VAARDTPRITEDGGERLTPGTLLDTVADGVGARLRSRSTSPPHPGDGRHELDPTFMPLSIFERVTGAPASCVMGAKSAGWKGDSLGFSDSTGRPPPSMRQRARRNEGGSISRVACC